MNPNIPKRESTFLESDEDIRAAIAARKLGVKPTSAPDPKPAIPKPAAIVPTPETAPTAGWIDVPPSRPIGRRWPRFVYWMIWAKTAPGIGS